MASDYDRNNTNALTRRSMVTKGIDRYNRSLTQTVTRTNAKGEKVSKEVEVKDGERIPVVANIIDNALDNVIAKIDEKVEDEKARQPGDGGGQRKGLSQIAAIDYTAAAMTAMNAMWEAVGKPNINRSRRVQLIGKRCESVVLHQAMRDQMGYKAKGADQEGPAQLRSERTPGQLHRPTRQRSAVSSSRRGITSCAPMSAQSCTMR